MGLLRTSLAPRRCHSEERGEWRHTRSHKQNTAHLEGWWRQRGDGQQLIMRSWTDSCCGTLQTSGCHYTACRRHPRLPAGPNYNSKIVIQAVWEFLPLERVGIGVFQPVRKVPLICLNVCMLAWGVLGFFVFVFFEFFELIRKMFDGNRRAERTVTYQIQFSSYDWSAVSCPHSAFLCHLWNNMQHGQH